MRGLRIGVDMSIFLNRFAGLDIDKLAMTADPPYPAPDLFVSLKGIHLQFAAVFLLSTFFDGLWPSVNNTCWEKRYLGQMTAIATWFDLREKAVELGKNNPSFSNTQLKETTKVRKATKHPMALNHANILRWLQE